MYQIRLTLAVVGRLTRLQRSEPKKGLQRKKGYGLNELLQIYLIAQVCLFLFLFFNLVHMLIRLPVEVITLTLSLW